MSKGVGGRLAKLHRKFRACRCEVCGTTDNLHTHHRNGQHFDDSPRNWQTLCQPCHLKIHRTERTPGAVAVSGNGQEGQGVKTLPFP